MGYTISNFKKETKILSNINYSQMKIKGAPQINFRPLSEKP